MAEAGLRVPLHILHLAIRHGKRMADPQAARGCMQYAIKMFKNEGEYALRVVVRESDWTIVHFDYTSVAKAIKLGVWP